MKGRVSVAAIAALALITLAACGSNETSGRAIEAPSATITVDGDTSDWAEIAGLDVALEAIEGEDIESKDATVKVAHDDEFIYFLLEVTDDYNWSADDAHLSGAAAVLWAIDEAAGPHMGAEEPDRETSLGVVDIWHWELECSAGTQSGGSVSDPGEGEGPGDDGACNMDDEWSTTPDEREDDLASGAENSLLGVWSHTSPTDDSEGTWAFEVSRPLVTGDEQDAELAAGETALLALAYWDPDNSPEGWGDDQHVVSANQGWIEVTLA